MEKQVFVYDSKKVLILNIILIFKLNLSTWIFVVLINIFYNDMKNMHFTTYIRKLQ